MKKKADKSRNKIKVPDWRKYRPENSLASTDSYYIKLASTVYKELRSVVDGDPSLWSKACLKDISIAAASYLEDTVSGLGIFKSFREKHKELYDTCIPFYTRAPFFMEDFEDECKDDDEHESHRDYEEDTINFQDVLFLIWYIVCVHYADSGIIFPQNLKILLMGYKIFDVLYMEYEDAPSNIEYAKLFAHIPEQADPIWMRKFCFNIASRNYLYGPDIVKRFEKYTENDKKGAQSINMSQSMYHYLSETVFSLEVRSRLLALDIFEITDRIARCHPSYHSELFKIDPYYFVFSTFKIIAVHETEVELEHTATGCVIAVELSSFTDMRPIEPQQYVSLGVLKKGTQWYFCGILIAHTGISESSSKNEMQKSREKCRLDQAAEQSRTDMVQNMHKAFVELYGRELVFLTPQEAGTFTGKFFRAYNDKIAAEKKPDELKDCPEPIFNDLNFSEAKNVTVYFNPKSGIELYPNIASDIKAEDNPFFESLSEDALFALVYQPDYSTEFYHEIIKLLLLKNSLRDTERYNRFTFGEFDFLKRFYSTKGYKSESNMYSV
jgi:hypothetical protein